MCALRMKAYPTMTGVNSDMPQGSGCRLMDYSYSEVRTRITKFGAHKILLTATIESDPAPLFKDMAASLAGCQPTEFEVGTICSQMFSFWTLNCTAHQPHHKLHARTMPKGVSLGHGKGLLRVTGPLLARPLKKRIQA